MTHEAYCAAQLKFREAEHFLAVGDEAFGGAMGLAEPARFPDLLSVKSVNGRPLYRLREVKFKLEDRLIRKAITQLESGLRLLPVREVDRVEIAVALRQRSLKPAEAAFLGEPLGENRYELRLDGESCRAVCGDRSYPVTAVLL
jgi:hypothetical protein